MKNLVYILLAVLVFTSCDNTDDPDLPQTYSDSISMGAGYAEEVYYSLENGIVKNVERSSWDIAFSADPMSSSILINEGYGVELFTYPNGDKDAWESVDTAGYGEWKALYNSDTTWFNGAFDRNQTGHPDYGWGVYTLTHDVVGDSIFIIRLSDGSLKKLLIEKRAAMNNTFSIKYANIDEAGVTKEIACSDYSSKNFVYFSFASEAVVDNEPASDAWDLLFTKYHDESIPYIVTGVLTNKDIEAAEVRGMDVSLADTTSATFSDNISIIGSDWKSFDMGTFSYLIEADLCYFVRKGEHMYKLTFTGTDGSMSGKIAFKVDKLN